MLCTLSPHRHAHGSATAQLSTHFTQATRVEQATAMGWCCTPTPMRPSCLPFLCLPGMRMPHTHNAHTQTFVHACVCVHSCLQSGRAAQRLAGYLSLGGPAASCSPGAAATCAVPKSSHPPTNRLTRWRSRSRSRNSSPTSSSSSRQVLEIEVGRCWGPAYITPPMCEV